MAEQKNPRFERLEVRTILACKEEANEARRNRMDMNRDNYECYHLRQDYSHKHKGQSKEFLAKQQTATEQLTSFLQQGLVDQGEWFSCDTELGVMDPAITASEIKRLLLRQLEKNNFTTYISDAIKSGLLGALMVMKVGGKSVLTSKFEARTKFHLFSQNRKTLVRKDKKIWQLELSLVRQEDYYPDPTGRGLYEIEAIEMDRHELLKIAKENPNEFDMGEVMACSMDSQDETQKSIKSRETGQNVPVGGIRKVVRIYEYWGDIIDPSTGECVYEDIVCAITEDGFIIRPPKKNPWWHGERPYIVCPIVRVPHSVWHRALMDAPTKHNRALNEIYNLQIDSGMMSVWGVKQLREDWLEDPSQVSDGVPPGITLLVNSSCPVGGKVVERVDTGSVNREGFEIYQMTDREFQTSAFTNDTRLGNLPQRAVKATEIVASNQSITGVFNGIVKTIEESGIAKILRLSWLAMSQNMNDLDLEDVKALLGTERAMILSNMAPEDRFAATAQGHKFKVFGLSMTLNKITDFRKYSTLLQVIGTSPEMLAEFKREYSMTKLMGEVIKSLDIKEERIKMDDSERAQYEQERAMAQQIAMMQAQSGKGGGQSPNNASQIPQMQNASQETGTDVPMSAINNGVTEPNG